MSRTLTSCAVLLLVSLISNPASAEREYSYSRDQYSCFVERLDLDVLGGNTSPPTMNSWVEALERGQMSRRELVSQVAGSAVFKASLVADLYQDVLGRDPDSSGLRYWSDNYRSSGQIAAELFGSEEYFESVNWNVEKYVDEVYRHFLSRSPDASGQQFWTSAIGKGMPRQRAVESLWYSIESSGLRVDRLYGRLLARRPDSAGRNYWATQLQNHDDIWLAAQLIRSAEYTERATGCQAAADPSSHAYPRVLVVGDSLTVGASRGGLSYWASAKYRTVVYALEGYTIEDGIRILRSINLADYDTVIFALGANDFRKDDAVLASKIDRAVGSAKGARMVWVNVDSGAQVLGGSVRFNTILSKMAKGYPNVTVADWDSFIRSRPDAQLLRHKDGVHYTPDGYRVMANWMLSLPTFV